MFGIDGRAGQSLKTLKSGTERGRQIREHIMLVKTAGVSKAVVVINKMDDPTVDWSMEQYNEIKDKLMPFLRASRFNLKRYVNFISVSAYTGANLKEQVPMRMFVRGMSSECISLLAGS
ncbi:translation termination factor GTPase eRF3 [Ceratobasidium sp. 394]|nr:translation termination factor GTPase eRF3 [Ceratobasidium sp. 394]